ncbi:hypothetical protein Pan44_50080 [Caulifigura coniformis]|uniref:Zinc-ribbon domain-containing protein n=1 Tax=Caulifigura coniformis TaxID=2527983 RepID=A0A517SLE7_9PLAN|nr:hypothetical protein [Caulifigura coniformis]QDT56945.1 hypothetical protein Pan44_50080 [Caulifigura coniformis]
MSRWTPDRDSADDPDDDWDEGEDAWADDDSETALAECPSCGADVYEDAVRCPICGEYITRSRSVWQGRPVWWRILGLAGILAVIIGIAFAAGL